MSAIKKLIRPVVPKWVVNHYRSMPQSITNRPLWLIRQLFVKWFRLPIWVVSKQGSKFFLGSDPIDDEILTLMLGKLQVHYFPNMGLDVNSNLLFLDVGAHHGLYAVEQLRRYPQAHLIALEPNPQAIPFIRKNLQANHLLDRVDIINAGIGTDDGVAVLYSDKSVGSWGDTTAPVEQLPDFNGKKIEVNLLTAATILKRRIPDMIKCNAEGAEFILFPQLFDMHIRPRHVILMAHPEFQSVDALLDLFREHNYTVLPAARFNPKRPCFYCVLAG